MPVPTTALQIAATVNEVSFFLINTIEGKTAQVAKSAVLAGAEKVGAVAAHRAEPDAHPPASITGLTTLLAAKLSTSHANGPGGAGHAVAAASVDGSGGSPGFIDAISMERLNKLALYRASTMAEPSGAYTLLLVGPSGDIQTISIDDLRVLLGSIAQVDNTGGEAEDTVIEFLFGGEAEDTVIEFLFGGEAEDTVIN